MIRIKSLLYPMSVGVALALELAIAPVFWARAQPNLLPSGSRLKQDITLPPPPTNPDTTTGGGRRDRGDCPQDAATAMPDSLLTALSPTTEPGLTIADRPTVLVYVPQTSAQIAEFSLLDQENNGIYQTTFNLTGTPDIIRFSLPSDAPPLEIGKNYTWYFALICNPENRLQDQFVTGQIQRTELDSALMQQIEQAPTGDRLSLYRLYRSHNIWYEALSVLVELRESQPDNPNLEAAWRELLQSGGLDNTNGS
ncbi:MAG: DUF928 domain-containing protein [Cyanobacteria bacterium RU_5_0]|nr:DUF928 domain-containing protein [Cyanobacteria bacterium RU_5_0]